MNFQKHKERFDQIDRLIRMKATGPPKALAKKLGISESHMYRLLDAMRMLGAPIEYSRKKQTYFYTRRGRFSIGFQLHQEREAMPDRESPSA